MPAAERERRQEEFDQAIRDVGRLPPDPVRLGAWVASDPQGMSVLLMAGWTATRRGCGERPELLPNLAWETLAGLPAVDAALGSVGAGWSLHPDPQARGDWLGQLRWAGDSVANIARLCRSGLIFGAVVLARTQLERWTANVAHRHGLEQEPQESSGEWIGRVWAVYGAKARVTAERSWILLSQWQHGRGIMPAACDTSWAGTGGCGEGVPGELAAVLEEVWACAALAFVQVRGAVWAIANRPDLVSVDDPNDPRLVDVALPDPAGSRFAALQATWTLRKYDEGVGFVDTMYAVDGAFPYTPLSDAIVARGERYRRFIDSAAGRAVVEQGIVQNLSEEAVLERRARAIATARLSFEQEAALVGDGFAPRNVNAKLFRFIAIAEAARMVARWSGPRDTDALRMAASALDSAWTLWLEDTNQAMACVRAVLEHTAAARCWRLRPVAAQQLADREAPPSRWIERAGWKRLSVLNQALGEFAHLAVRTEWQRARSTLLVHHDAAGEPDPELTARGGMLNATAYLLADEVIARLETADPRLAEVFRSKVTLLEPGDHVAMLEGLLERGLAARLQRTRP